MRNNVVLIKNILLFYHRHVVQPGEVLRPVLVQPQPPFSGVEAGVEVEAVILAALRPVKAVPSHQAGQ